MQELNATQCAVTSIHVLAIDKGVEGAVTFFSGYRYAIDWLSSRADVSVTSWDATRIRLKRLIEVLNCPYN